jgi:hypothetical protein
MSLLLASRSGYCAYTIAKAAQAQTIPMMNQRSDLPSVMMHPSQEEWRELYIAGGGAVQEEAEGRNRFTFDELESQRCTRIPVDLELVYLNRQKGV